MTELIYAHIHMLGKISASEFHIWYPLKGSRWWRRGKTRVEAYIVAIRKRKFFLPAVKVKAWAAYAESM